MKRLIPIVLAAACAACVPSPSSTPEPTPPPARPVTPPPSQTVPPVAAAAGWMEAPVTPGSWTLRLDGGATTASFGDGSGDARFTMRCDRASRQVVLTRAGTASATVAMRIRTETSDRTLAAQTDSSTVPSTNARLGAADPLLDAIALSRGRFAVDSPGLPQLVLPPWAEVTRVIEDCR